MAEGSHPEFEQTWLGLERVRPGTRAVSHAKRLDDGRLVVDVSVAEPWTWAPLMLMCRSCEDMSKTEHRIYRNNPTAVDTTVTRPCPCGDVQVVAEVYTLYDESNGKPYQVRNARRSTIVPTAATAAKFKHLADVVRAHERGEATDRDVVEAALQVDPAVSKRIRRWPSWLAGDWHKTAGVIIAALMIPPAYATAWVALESDSDPEPAHVERTEDEPDHVKLSVPVFLELLDRAAASPPEVTPRGGGTAPEAPPADPASPPAP